MSKKIIDSLKAMNKIVICVSGGKDSSVLLWWAKNNFPIEKLVAVHAVIDIDWPQTKRVVEKQCRQMGIPLIFVQAQFADGTEKGILSKLTAPRIDRKTGEAKENLWPDALNRWCTAEMKIAPIHKYVRSLIGKIGVLIGERRQESNQRAKLEAWRPNEKLSKSGRVVVDCSPILDLTEDEVWSIIDKNKIIKHPCYEWGVSRCSCAICIFSKDAEILIAKEKAPKLVDQILEAEKKISHTFRYKKATKSRPATKETIADILKKAS